MVGTKMSKDILDNTLICICKILNSANLKDWFICYGTLLGIIRENGCIDNDDDIDIIISAKHYDIVKDLLIKNNFELETRYGIKNSKKILKTKTKTVDGKIKYASIDIYMSEHQNENDVYDLWNKLLIKDCHLDNKKKTFIRKTWKGEVLYIPKRFLSILENRYGKEWNKKQDKKIPQTMKVL
jgi:phosphorylcholine metabolism protein LicD